MRNFPEFLRSLQLKENGGFTPGDQGEHAQIQRTEDSPQTSSEAPSPSSPTSSAEAAPKQPSTSDLQDEITHHKSTTSLRTLNFPDSDDEEMSRKS